jgi:hypothetical protein
VWSREDEKAKKQKRREPSQPGENRQHSAGAEKTKLALSDTSRRRNLL